MKSCETCKHDLGVGTCKYSHELECVNDDYQLWEQYEPIGFKPIADEIEELYRDQVETEMEKLGATEQEFALLHDATIRNAIRKNRSPKDVAEAILE